MIRTAVVKSPIYHNMASLQATTKTGTQINVEGAGPEFPMDAPSNRQIDSMISDAQHQLEADKAHLDEHGRAIVSSTQGVLDATSLLINEKNKQERFQKLFLFTKGSAEGGPSEGLTQAVQNLMSQATGIGSKISDDATNVLAYVRETLFNLTTSSEFRQLAVEFINLLQSMMGELKSVMQERDTQPLEEKIRVRIYETDNERMQDINEKLTILLEHIGRQPQYQTVVRNFIIYSEQIYTMLYKAKQDSIKTQEVDDLKKTIDQAWEILHDFIGRESSLVPKFKKNLSEVLEEVGADNELVGWLTGSKLIMMDLMENPDNAAKDPERTRQMIEMGRGLTEKYRPSLEHLYSDAQKIVDRIQSDPVIRNFQNQLEKLGRELALNSKGQPDLFVLEKSMNVIRDLLVERFRSVLVDVPIKRVQVQNDTINVILTNITVQGTGLVPNHLLVELSSASEFYFDKSPDAQQKFKLHLKVDEIKPQFKNVTFVFDQKVFPHIKDNGTADIAFEGSGLSVDVAVEFIIKANQISRANITSCTAVLDSVSLHIGDAHHDILGTILMPYLQATLRTKIESGVQEVIDAQLHQLIDQLNNWFASKPFEALMMKSNEALHELVKDNSLEFPGPLPGTTPWDCIKQQEENQAKIAKFIDPTVQQKLTEQPSS